jgi:iron complex outermembrane recepter protein
MRGIPEEFRVPNRVRTLIVSILLTAGWLGAADAQTAAVKGRIVDGQGMSVAGAALTLVGSGGRRLEARSDADGSFSIPVDPGAYTLRAEAPGFAIWTQNVTASASAPALTISLQISGLSEAISVVGIAPSTLSTPTITGTRLGLTALDTPASVQIISGDVVRERGDQTVQEAKTRAVGVTMQGDPGNGGNAVVARGFGGVGSVMQLFDGDQLFVGAGTVTFPFDPWTVERIEVLGGPSSVLYGNGAIGGAVNIVPRKPNPYATEGAVRLGVGSFNTWRGAVDAGGPISDSTSYRFDLSANRSSGWVRDNDSKNLALSASLRHQFSPTVTLTVSEDFGRQEPGEYFGTPTIDGAIDERFRDVNYNVADSDIWYRDNWTQFKLEWQPSANVKVRSGVHLLATDRHWRNAEEYVFNTSNNTIDRDSFIEIFHKQRQYGDRTDVVVTSRPMGLANTFAGGFDYNFVTFQHTNNSPYGGSNVTDLENSTPAGFINLAGTVPKYRTQTHQVAFFAEDRLAVTAKLSLVGGVRLDRYAAERLSLVNDTTSQRTYTPASWRGGVVYTLKPGLTAYGQVATATDTLGDIISNNPNSMLLDPTTGRQVEGGLKQSLWNQRAEWTVAGYHIVKDKLLAPIAGRPGEVQQVGSQSSRGVEATAAVNLPAGVRLEGNVAFLDARYDDYAEEFNGVVISREGQTPPSVPERSINFWATWNAPADWQFRGGVRSVGPRYWDTSNTTRIPTYNVIDGGVRKRLMQDLSVDLYLYNLTNTLYATDFYYNGFAPQWMLGTPRSAEVALTLGF